MGDFLGGLPTVLIATAGGYLLGSIPLAYLISKRHSGVDIFEVGTGLPGASNVIRNVGKLPAVMVFLGDMAKGALAILLCNVMGVEVPGCCFPWARRSSGIGSRCSPAFGAATASSP